MINKDLLAATAVFAELVNNNIDYKEIINNFILSVYNLESKYSMNSQEVCEGLAKHYDFNIPEAVVKTQLVSLYKKDLIDYIGGNYLVSPEILQKNSEISQELNSKTQIQNKIFDRLINYIQAFSGNIGEIKRDEINTYFVNYLFDESFNGEYSGLVSAFILHNSGDENFKNELNLIREGVIILRGLKYSSDIENDLHFKNELHIYLDTEHLFSINGYNGELHNKILRDFYDLVRDLNSKQSSKKIFLHFFEEAKNEVNRLFTNANDIFDKKKPKDIASEALKYVLNGVNDKSDIIRKESKFFENLKTMGIFEADLIEIPEEKFAEYNLESNQVLEKYSLQYKEDDILNVLKCFTNINYLRKGKNQNNLDNIKHILVSGDNLTRKISMDGDAKIAETDFSFSTDIYYITQRLWFKLNKGFGFKGKLPTTLDVVSKAQVILSYKLNNVVRERFEKIKKDIEIGTRTENEVKSYFIKLREKAVLPEDLNPDNIEEKTNFLFDNEDLENHIRQESLMMQELEELKKYRDTAESEKQRELENAIIEATRVENIRTGIFNKKIDKKIKLVNFSSYLIPILIIVLIIFLRRDDKVWDIVDTIIYIIPFVFWLGFFKLKKKIIVNLENKKLNEIE